jgi:steroid delta-isomerase-like uncharacterized protein
MTPDEMDAVFERHCAAEMAKDLDAILATLADGAEHDLVGDRVLTEPEDIAKRYSDLFDSLVTESMTTVHRYHGADFMVDESLCDGRVVGDFLGMPGNGNRVSFRILHVCEFRDGRMSRENVWLDTGAIVQQLAA